MRTLWKVLVPLALVLPLGAFVVGAVSATVEEPTPRRTIVIHDPSSSPAPGPTTGTPSPRAPRATPGRSRTAGPDDDGSVEVVTPHPEDLGDDHGGDRPSGGRDDSGGGSSSGSGSGSDDSGGSSGGSGGSGGGSDDSGGGGGDG